MWFPPPFIVFSLPFSFCASGWIFSPDLYSSSQILSSAMFKLMLNLLWGSYCQSSHSIHFFCCFIYFWNYPSCRQFLSILKVILIVWYFWSLYFCGSTSILCFSSFLVVWSSSMPGIFDGLLDSTYENCRDLRLLVVVSSSRGFPHITFRLWVYASIQLKMKQIQS